MGRMVEDGCLGPQGLFLNLTQRSPHRATALLTPPAVTISLQLGARVGVGLRATFPELMLEAALPGAGLPCWLQGAPEGSTDSVTPTGGPAGHVSVPSSSSRCHHPPWVSCSCPPLRTLSLGSHEGLHPFP